MNSMFEHKQLIGWLMVAFGLMLLGYGVYGIACCIQ